ncbi:hypothetical protein [Neorhizobium sp. P12A]|uniref:hypothetical protein n=1 Tax=Neorhizobium sp. P12A TaxID=2268027 RepID=UPI00165E5D92|nr:hypothetical protein [Neorhizobium sp. P12A]
MPISFSHGAEWNTLISKYIDPIPPSEEGSAPHIISMFPAVGNVVMIAMAAKVGAAAIGSHVAIRHVNGWGIFDAPVDRSI